MMKFDIIKELSKTWEKKITIALLIPFVLALLPIIPESVETQYKLIVIIAVYGLIIIFWLITTHRWIFPTSKFLVELYVNFLEEEAENQLRHVIDDTVKTINSQVKNIKIVRRPFNSVNDENRICEKLKRRLFVRSKLIIISHVTGGNITENNKTTYKAQVDKFKLIGDFYIERSVRVHKLMFKIKDALSICDLKYKDWSYIQCNSFNDNKKIKSNLEDTILFCVGLYDILYREFDDAISILLELYKNNRGKNEFLSVLLMNLIFDVALKNYFDGKGQKAYSLLKKCDELFPQNQRLDRYVPLARFAYECNDLQNAKYYTEKLMLEENGKFYGYVNRGFFAIIDGNEDTLAENYTKIYNYSNNRKNENMVDVVEFLDKEKEKYLQYLPLFEFAEGFLTRLFYDEVAGAKMLNDFLEKYDEHQYIHLYPLCRKALTKREPQKNYKKKARRKVKRH